MPDLPTLSDYQRIARDEILAHNTRLSSDAAQRDGSDVNIMLAAGAAVADEVTGQLANATASLFLDSAAGTDLDRLVFDRYGLVRKPAASALGSVQFSVPTATTSSFTIPSGTVLQTSDGIQFITVQQGVFPISSTGPVIVAVASTLAGANQQAASGTITSIISQIVGSPSGLTVTNTLATAGAADAETDDSLRSRARNFFTTSQLGTVASVINGALSVAGVQTANAIEVIDTTGRPTRFVQLVITDAFTTSLVGISLTSAAGIAYQTQSQQLAFTVFNALAAVRAAGAFVNVFVAQVVFQAISLNLRFAAGVNVDQVAITARSSVVSFVNSLAAGATLRRSDIINVLKNVTGLLVFGDEIISPPGDVVPKTLQVIRTTLGIVTVTALQSDRPLTQSGNPDAFIIAGTGS